MSRQCALCYVRGQYRVLGLVIILAETHNPALREMFREES